MAALCVAAIAACGEPTGPSSPVATYSLSTVATKALPAVLYTETGYSLEVTAGEITLSADSTYATTYSVKETVDGFASQYVDHGLGRWVQTSADGAITLTPAEGPTQSAMWTGSKLQVTVDSVTFVFTRQ